MQLTALTTPNAPIAQGAPVGTMRENWYGVVQPPEPVLAGELIGPTKGWASLADARAGIAELFERSADGQAHPIASGSSAGIFAQEGRFVARYLRNQHGRDVRLWHIPTELIPADPRWVATVDAPLTW